MQKFSDSCERNETVSPHQYCLVDYGNPSNGQYHPYHPYPQVINQLGNLPGLLQYNIGTIHQVPMLQIGVHSGVNTENVVAWVLPIWSRLEKTIDTNDLIDTSFPELI